MMIAGRERSQEPFSRPSSRRARAAFSRRGRGINVRRNPLSDDSRQRASTRVSRKPDGATMRSRAGCPGRARRTEGRSQRPNRRGPASRGPATAAIFGLSRGTPYQMHENISERKRQNCQSIRRKERLSERQPSRRTWPIVRLRVISLPSSLSVSPVRPAHTPRPTTRPFPPRPHRRRRARARR